MLFRSNPSSGVPLYLQLIEQVKHAVDVGAVRPGDQLPTIRRVAEDIRDQSEHRGQGVP